MQRTGAREAGDSYSPADDVTLRREAVVLKSRRSVPLPRTLVSVVPPGTWAGPERQGRKGQLLGLVAVGVDVDSAARQRSLPSAQWAVQCLLLQADEMRLSVARPGTRMSREARLSSSFGSPGSWSRRSVMSVRTPERGAGAGSTHRKWQKKNILRGEMPLQPKKKVEGWALAWLEGTGPHPLAAHPCSRRGRGAVMTQR